MAIPIVVLRKSRRLKGKDWLLLFLLIFKTPFCY
jgi:hypothetical protein